MKLFAQLQGGGNSTGSTQSLDLSHYFQLALRNIWAILTIVFLGTAVTVYYLTASKGWSYILTYWEVENH